MIILYTRHHFKKALDSPLILIVFLWFLLPSPKLKLMLKGDLNIVWNEYIIYKILISNKLLMPRFVFSQWLLLPSSSWIKHPKENHNIFLKYVYEIWDIHFKKIYHPFVYFCFPNGCYCFHPGWIKHPMGIKHFLEICIAYFKEAYDPPLGFFADGYHFLHPS